MVLNDVWRSIGSDVGFFYEANFVDVPSAPGVYAWFYPLRVLSRSVDDLFQLVGSVQALLNYDAIAPGVQRHGEIPFAWWTFVLACTRRPKALTLSEPIQRAWAQITATDESFAEFQQALLKASIFMPPLYVGKADNLNTRCVQHLVGVLGANDFHSRFEEFARGLALPIRSVRQLIFACVRTGTLNDAPQEGRGPVHELIESIMKSICAPPYGLR